MWRRLGRCAEALSLRLALVGALAPRGPAPNRMVPEALEVVGRAFQLPFESRPRKAFGFPCVASCSLRFGRAIRCSFCARRTAPGEPRTREPRFGEKGPAGSLQKAPLAACRALGHIRPQTASSGCSVCRFAFVTWFPSLNRAKSARPWTQKTCTTFVVCQLTAFAGCCYSRIASSGVVSFLTSAA